MTFFDFLVAVSLGSLVANMTMGATSNEITAGTALVCLSVLVIVTDYLHIKSMRVRKLVNSESVTVIDNGSIVEDNLRRIRLTIDELNMKLREKNMFSLADVEFAILESDGQMSVLPKAGKAPLTPSQANITATSPGLMKDIVIDGELLEENLSSAGLDTACCCPSLAVKVLTALQRYFMRVWIILRTFMYQRKTQEVVKNTGNTGSNNQ